MVALPTVEIPVGHVCTVGGPTTRWTDMYLSRAQALYYYSTSRFNICHAGRRSGKSEIAKRRKIRDAINFSSFPDGLFIFGAPTLDQAKSIFWGDIKRLIPSDLVRKKWEGDGRLLLHTGTLLSCVGMDKPERIEGRPIDDGVLDEYANMHPHVWTDHLRPALDTLGRPGKLDFTGVPEGWNHYRELVLKAEAYEDKSIWKVHHWPSWDILPADVIASAQADLDPLVFQQEYGGRFVSYLGRAYYCFSYDRHVVNGVHRLYNDQMDLIVCFDFNRSPGVALVCQEHSRPIKGRKDLKESYTVCIEEIYIPKNSNTLQVCDMLVQKYGGHKGRVRLYGDASGGNKTTSSVSGSDWELIIRDLRQPGAFGGRVERVGPMKKNPTQRSRLNAVNSRLLSGPSGDAKVGMIIDGKMCPNLVRDFEGVGANEDGSIDKSNELLSHISDACGYYIAERFPVHGQPTAEHYEL